MQVMARSEAARFNTNRFVTVLRRLRRATTTQTKVLPTTLIRKIMAYRDNLTALKTGVSPANASEELFAPCTSVELFDEFEFTFMSVSTDYALRLFLSSFCLK